MAKSAEMQQTSFEKDRPMADKFLKEIFTLVEKGIDARDKYEDTP